MNPCKIWIDQCEAARNIEDGFGTEKALDYLMGEKFINFLEAADTHPTSVIRFSGRRRTGSRNMLSASGARE